MILGIVVALLLAASASVYILDIDALFQYMKAFDLSRPALHFTPAKRKSLKLTSPLDAIRALAESLTPPQS